MQSFKQFLQFYLVGIVVVFMTALILGNKPLPVLASPGLYILPAIFCVVGFITGLIIFEINLRPFDKKKKIFFFSYCFGTLALLTITIILGINRVREIDHKKQFGNIESNHAVMKTWVNDDEEYIRIAFNRLQKEFKNPNDFELDAFSVRKHDTIINGVQDTIYNVYFIYFVNNDKKSKYFSKISVLTANPELKVYNADTRINEEYKRIKAEQEAQEYEMMKDLKDLNNVLKRFKDSLKKND